MMSVYDYGDVVCSCFRCLGEIYDNEVWGEDEYHHPICIDCLEEEWKELSAVEKFERLGYDAIV